MNEFEELFGDEFFIIDSLKLDLVKSNFFGFAIHDGDIIQNCGSDVELNNEGCYVKINVVDEIITISQDFNGSYGLYLYNVDGYFAISNSFIKLVNYLKKFKDLSFNKKYADAFLFADLCSFSYKETLINEIRLIPRNYEVIIDKKLKMYYFNQLDFKEQTVPIDSKEGLKILDEWYNKWVNIFRSLKQKTNNISVDLSGGLDSRAVAALWLTAGIDLNKLYVQSFGDVNGEDFAIASVIADDFNFELNNYNNIQTEKKYFKDINTIFNVSFFPKLGFHQQMGFSHARNNEVIYRFGGLGGEVLRSSPNQPTIAYYQSILDRSNRFSKELEDSVKYIIKSSLKRVKEKFDITDINSRELPRIFYKETRCRNHFGKGSVEAYLSNVLSISPLLDPNLNKLKLETDICDDESLLVALIYLRYCPKLLEYKIEGNREIPEEVISHINEINNITPFIFDEKEIISGPIISEVNETSKNQTYIPIGEPDNLLIKMFYSRFFEMEFKKYYSSKVYFEISNRIKSSKFFPLSHVYAAISILMIVNATKFRKHETDTIDFINSFLDEKNVCEGYDLSDDVEMLLSKYVTARIDLLNSGSEENFIEIVECDDINSKIFQPPWFKSNKGQGLIVQSAKGCLNLEFKCVNEGLLKIWIRSLDIKDNTNTRLPIFIDYINVKINDEDYIKENTLLSFEKFMVITREVKDSELIKIHLEWLPFNQRSIIP